SLGMYEVALAAHDENNFRCHKSSVLSRSAIDLKTVSINFSKAVALLLFTFFRDSNESNADQEIHEFAKILKFWKRQMNCVFPQFTQLVSGYNNFASYQRLEE